MTYLTPKARSVEEGATRPRASLLLADDHPMMAEGLRRVLEPEFDIVGTVGDGQALVAAAGDLRPDVIVADVSMPILSGIEAARLIRELDPHVVIVFLTMHFDVTYAAEALRVGAAAYILKTLSSEEIVAAIHNAVAGRAEVAASPDRRVLDIRLDDRADEVGRRISPRQLEVLQMIAAGRSTKQIAAVLGISSRTVEFHRYRMMQSLGLHTIAELVQYAIKHRLIML